MTNKLVICACRWRRFVPQMRIDELIEKARQEGREVEIVDDLCECMAKADHAEATRLSEGTIAACYERAVESLFDWREVKVSQVLCLRTSSSQSNAIRENVQDAWYPVIDKKRCTECGKCHDFCPFGVYEIRNGCVKVIHPEKCKNNCPACARNCPSQAIIFPKYNRSPINGGEEMEEKVLQVDHSSLYADAFRARLMERRSSGTPLFKLKK